MAMNWKHNILERQEEICELLRQTRRIAVLGIKTEAQQSLPAFYVPAYLAKAGFEVIPVPIYYPEVTQILGQQVYRELNEIPGEIDLVNVFRRAQDLHGHVTDILAKQPKAVWLQSGIRNHEIAQTFARANIKVVQDRCLMVEHRFMPSRSDRAR
jgi:predicted CoA-binding protein